MQPDHFLLTDIAREEAASKQAASLISDSGEFDHEFVYFDAPSLYNLAMPTAGRFYEKGSARPTCLPSDSRTLPMDPAFQVKIEMRLSVSLLRQPLTILFLCCLCCGSGCSKDDGIRQYTVETIPPPERAASPAMAVGNAQPAWFVKLTGPADTVLQEIVPFSKILQTLRFDAAGNPQYEVPDDWKVSSGPAPRYQTIKIGDTDPPLEVTVSSLPGPETAYDQYLLSNLNRWRGQMHLEPYTGDGWLEAARSSGELAIIPQKTRVIAMVNFAGESPEGKKERMLAAVVLSPPQGSAEEEAGATPAPETPSDASPPFDYKLPAGWSPSAGNSMRLASFSAPHVDGAADVSVTRFPGGGDVLSNINRWRQQVKLDPLKEEELKDNVQELQIGGKPATSISAIGKEQSILAAIIPDGDAKWFVKMQGPTAAVKAESEHFQEFLKSIQFDK